MHPIYKTIRELRIKKGFSQKDLAERLGITQTSYGKIERGDTQLTIERLTELAQLLEVKVEEIVVLNPYEIEEYLKIESIKEKEFLKEVIEKLREGFESFLRKLNKEYQKEYEKHEIKSINDYVKLGYPSSTYSTTWEEYNIPIMSKEDSEECFKRIIKSIDGLDIFFKLGIVQNEAFKSSWKQLAPKE